MIVGTAGHIDHGKTSLVKALTGVDTDRLKEEKARGISIDLGFAYLPTPDGGTIGFVDVPGHERFVHTMLAGASGIDLALLVVAADDGPMPQTAEHLAILDLLGVPGAIVALTKADLVDDDRLASAKAAVLSAVAGTRFAGCDILPVSTRTGAGVATLRERLFGAAAAASERRADRLFRLAVDRSFTLPGAGTVVTGTVLSGTVAVGDAVVVSPGGLPARVRAIHAQNQASERGRAGQRCALNLAGEGVTKGAIRRGDVVCAPSLHAPAARIDAELHLLPTEPKPVVTWMPVRVHHAAADVAGRLVPLSDEALAPGSSGLVQLVLEAPIAAAVGDRFVLRDTSGQRTVGGGRFVDLRAPARKRRTPERLAQIRAGRHDDPAEALAAMLDVAPFQVELGTFLRDRTLPPEAGEALVRRLGLVELPLAGSSIVLSAATFARIERALEFRLAEFHSAHPDLMGIGQERLRLELNPRLPAPAFRSLLRRLAEAEGVALEGAWIRLASHTVQLSPADEERWSAIVPLIGGVERFRPPRVRDLAGAVAHPEADLRRLMKLTSRLGRTDEVAHDHFFLRSTVSEMVDILAGLAQDAPKGEFTAAQFRDKVENGRKVAIQILEFFDRHGVTLRRGDLRRLNPHRLDLFRPLGAPASPEEPDTGGEAALVGRPDFKSGRGREPVSGGFDSHSLPPHQASPP